MRVCGMTADEAKAYTPSMHSARHFLPLIAEARGEPPERAIDVRRWSGSVAQDRKCAPCNSRTMSDLELRQSITHELSLGPYYLSYRLAKLQFDRCEP